MDFNYSEIVKYPGLGSGLAASRDFEEGDAIVRVNEPYLIIVEKKALQEVCSQCMYELPNLARCSGCKVVSYCSTKCQRTAWKSGHKLECPLYQRLPGVLPTEVRGIVNLLLRKLIGTKPDPRWSSLEGHASSLREQKKWGDIVLQAKAAVEYSGSTDTCMEPVVELLCRMAANAFRVTLPCSKEIGLCFEPLVSLANHSCSPNAIVMFDGRKLFLSALVPIRAGDQIFISYIDTTCSRDERRAQLQASYFFHCECERCTETGFEVILS